MPSTPKVSIILTSYNHAKYLREAIDSALHQTYTDFELIIWDDASTDNSWEIIQSYNDNRIRAFRNETNKRVGNARKAISEVAVGKYIAIHSSDDIWEPEKLGKQVNFLEENQHIGAVFSRALIIGEDGKAFDNRPHFYYSAFDQPNRSRYEWLNFFFYHGNALCHPSLLIRKVCYQDCGLYRYGFSQLPDLDMWVRLCLQYEIYIMEDKLVRFRVRSGELNVSGNRLDTKIQWQFDYLQVINNYRSIRTPDEFIKVFPAARKYLKPEGFDVDFALAMMALEPKTMNTAKLFGLKILFDLINEPEKAVIIDKLYNFTPKQFIKLSAQHDIFSLESESILGGQKKTIKVLMGTARRFASFIRKMR